jgi:hypothetical protein
MSHELLVELLVELQPAEGALLRVLGTVERRGFGLRGVTAARTDANRQSLRLELTATAIHWCCAGNWNAWSTCARFSSYRKHPLRSKASKPPGCSNNYGASELVISRHSGESRNPFFRQPLGPRLPPG